MNSDEMIKHMIDRGVAPDHIEMMRYCGVDFDNWLSGFDTVENSVSETVEFLRHHPLLPNDVKINGFIMDSVTGALTPLVEMEL